MCTKSPNHIAFIPIHPHNYTSTEHVYQITKSLHFTNHTIEMGMEYLAQFGELAGGAFTSPEQSLGRRPSLRKHSSRARVGGCRSWGALLLLLLQGRAGRWWPVVRGRSGGKAARRGGLALGGVGGRRQGRTVPATAPASRLAGGGVARRVGDTGSRGHGLAGVHGEQTGDGWGNRK